MGASGSRRHRLARVITSCSLVSVLIGGIAVVSAPAGAAGTFTDDDGSVHETNIEQLARMAVTRGCNPPVNDRYCPDEAVTRGQMAAFLHRALDGILTPGQPVEFTDDDTSVFENDIEWLAATGVTRGCNPPDNTRYCPDDAVTRGQMAAFLHRALDGILTPGQPVEFTDDDTSVFENDIEWLAATGVTRGCNPPDNTRYCPDDAVTRAQMASFLVRALVESTEGTTSSSTSTTDGSSTTAPTSSTTTTASPPPPPPPGDAEWTEILDGDGPTHRHEAGFVRVGDRLYLLGGRRNQPIQYYDLVDEEWVDTGAETSNIHHFQPVALGNRIFIVGALEGQCCHADFETPVATVMVFDTQTGQLDESFHPIPEEFRRGATGAVAYQGDIYIVSGNTGGHGDEEEPVTTQNLDLLTKYDPDAPAAQRWQALDPIPHERDHFNAVVVGSKLYVVGGRTSESGPLNEIFKAVVPTMDVYDFNTGSWSSSPHDLPAPRAAAATAAIGAGIYVIGGEGGSMSASGDLAWDRVDRFDTSSNQWEVLPPIPLQRHGTGAAVCGDDIFVAAGATTRGGSSETDAFHALDTNGDNLGCLG